MFSVDVENLRSWLITTNKEIDAGANRSAISLWCFLSTPISPTMFSGQSSKELYDAISNTKNLLILRDLIADTLSAIGFGSIMGCKKFLEFDLVPQQDRNAKFVEAELLKEADRGKFPYVVFYADIAKDLVQFPISSNVSVHSDIASIHYWWSKLEGDARIELCECVFNPTPELSHLENFELLKQIIGYRPFVKLPIQTV